MDSRFCGKDRTNGGAGRHPTNFNRFLDFARNDPPKLRMQNYETVRGAGRSGPSTTNSMLLKASAQDKIYKGWLLIAL